MPVRTVMPKAPLPMIEDLMKPNTAGIAASTTM